MNIAEKVAEYIKLFMLNKDSILEISSWLVTITTLMVAIWAIRNATYNTNRQIKVQKIEEIYEITSFLYNRYPTLLFLYNTLKDHHDYENYDAFQRQNILVEYEKRLSEIKSNLDVDKLSEKTGRLKILANAYLNDNLRLQTLAYNDMFDKLLMISLQGSIMYKNIFYKEGFPTELELHKFLEEMQVEFIKLISMTGKSIKMKDLQTYRESKYKYEVGLNKTSGNDLKSLYTLNYFKNV